LQLRAADLAHDRRGIAGLVLPHLVLRAPVRRGQLPRVLARPRPRHRPTSPLSSTPRRARIRPARRPGWVARAARIGEDGPMASPLAIRRDGALDLLALGAMVTRLDPGIVPFHEATSYEVHVSGGEFNVAANAASAFGLRTAIATAMVDYPIGRLVEERI